MINSKQDSGLYKQTIALAGVFQAAALVEELATKGSMEATSALASLKSIFKQNAASVEDVFDGQVNFIPGLALGFERLSSLLDASKSSRGDLLRYALALLHLETKAHRNPEMLNYIGERIAQVKEKLAHRTADDELILANLAGIYEDSFGTFRQRIQVNGNRLYLENPLTVNKVRALLLAGVRSAMLWRQVGGNRWRLFLHRGQILETAKSLAG